MQNEVFDKLYKINRKYKDVKISDVGCYELKYEDVKKISKKEMTKILFKSQTVDKAPSCEGAFLVS